MNLEEEQRKVAYRAGTSLGDAALRYIADVYDTDPTTRTPVQYSNSTEYVEFANVNWSLDGSVKLSFQRVDDKISVREMRSRDGKLSGTFSEVTLDDIGDLISALQKLVS